MSQPKDKHLHIRWSEEDEKNLRFVMDHYTMKKSDAVRMCVDMVADFVAPKHRRDDE